MAGQIPRMVTAVNRTTSPLDAMFDGQPVVLVAGYVREGEDANAAIVGAGPGGSVRGNPLPYFAAEMVKRQNPRMGTEDPTDPRDFESLVGILEWDDDVSHIEQSAAVERLDRELLDDEAQTAKSIRTSSGRKLEKARKRGQGGRFASDARLKNPIGIRANYND